MLWDFYSQLNHDLAGYGYENRDVYNFILKKKFVDLSELEISELDKLSELLSASPDVDELISFYLESFTLRISELENDIYSFVNHKI